MSNRISRLIAACALIGTVALPVSAQDNSTTMQGSTTTGTMGAGSMGTGTMMGDQMGSGTMSGGMMGNMSGGMSGDGMMGTIMMGNMMDDTMRNYVMADQAGQARILDAMTLRQQVEFLTRFHKMPVTTQMMVNLGMIGPNMMNTTMMTPGNMGGAMTGAESSGG